MQASPAWPGATVTRPLDALLASGYICAGSNESSTGGRPQGTFQINQDFGVLLLADIGARNPDALANIHGKIKERRQFLIELNDGPEAVLGQVKAGFLDLLAGAGHGIPGRSRGSASACPARWNSPPAGSCGHP